MHEFARRKTCHLGHHQGEQGIGGDVDLFSDIHVLSQITSCNSDIRLHKRHANTQSRREVVGQVLEYAANAHHYWNREQLREMASESAGKRNYSVEDEFKRLGIRDTEDD